MTARASPTAPDTAVAARVFLDLGEVQIPLHVRRHARARRASLRLSSEGDRVIVVLPPRTRIEDGLAIARAHASWIRARLDAQLPWVPFADGSVLPVDGRALIVHLVPHERRGVRIDGDRLLVGGLPVAAAACVHAWLRGEARRSFFCG